MAKIPIKKLSKREDSEEAKRALAERITERSGVGLVIEKADGTRLVVGPGGILTQEK